jgi:GrpB-like predicted nucleotidyltransferase (UPF0157 family)
VRFQIDMEVVDLLESFRLRDRNAIDEVLGFDQHAIDEHRMVRRNPEIARGYIDLKCARLDADRKDILAADDETASVADGAYAYASSQRNYTPE